VEPLAAAITVMTAGDDVVAAPSKSDATAPTV